VTRTRVCVLTVTIRTKHSLVSSAQSDSKHFNPAPRILENLLVRNHELLQSDLFQHYDVSFSRMVFSLILLPQNSISQSLNVSTREIRSCILSFQIDSCTIRVSETSHTYLCRIAEGCTHTLLALIAIRISFVVTQFTGYKCGYFHPHCAETHRRCLYSLSTENPSRHSAYLYLFEDLGLKTTCSIRSKASF